jgi:hypothetical protein
MLTSTTYFPEIGPLSPSAARIAIAKRASDLRVAFDSRAVEQIVAETKGYPYFLQEWGQHSWDAASAAPIKVSQLIAKGMIWSPTRHLPCRFSMSLCVESCRVSTGGADGRTARLVRNLVRTANRFRSTFCWFNIATASSSH